MINKKSLTILILINLCVFSNIQFVSANNVKENYEINGADSIKDNYTIDKVPYIGQSTNFYCYLSSVTMVIKYYGYNSTLNEILYNLGCGYALKYSRYFTPVRLPVGMMGIAGYESYFSFLPGLYNLSYERSNYYNSELTENECWDKYWQRVKENVSNDKPVITSVNPYLLPYLIKYVGNETSEGGHAVVIVGYNDTNNTVCVNDPAPGFWNDNANGTYIYVSQDDFKQAVNETIGIQYLIDLIYKPDDFIPVSENKRYEIAHNKNLERMKGYIASYNNDVNYNFRSSYLGINALKLFRRDLRFGITHKYLSLFIIKLRTYQSLEFYYYVLYCEKNNASQYLLNNTHLSHECYTEGLLLKKESNCWLNFTMLMLQLKNITNNKFLISWWKSIPLLYEMTDVLSDIISIQKEIINNKSKF